MTKAKEEKTTVIEGYNAVAEVRKIRDQLAEEMKDMTPDERIAYLQDQAAKFRRKNRLPET